MFTHDGMLTFTETLYWEYLQYDYTTCIVPSFVHVSGCPGTFAENLSFDFPDSISASYILPLPDDSVDCRILLDAPSDCSSVVLVVDRLGFKAVVNSQPLHTMLDGPGGTRLELFNRILRFFDMQTNLEENETPIIPNEPLLLSAYPNPFNSSVRLSLSSSVDSKGTIEIYDITGRLVRRFSYVSSDAVWDGTTSDGNSVGSGIYFARVLSNTGTHSAVKLTLLK